MQTILWILPIKSTLVVNFLHRICMAKEYIIKIVEYSFSGGVRLAPLSLYRWGLQSLCISTDIGWTVYRLGLTFLL